MTPPNSYVIDAYPYSIEQADGMEKSDIIPNKIVELSISKDEMMARARKDFQEAALYGVLFSGSF